MSSTIVGLVAVVCALLASPGSALAISVAPTATSLPGVPGAEAEPNDMTAVTTPITSGSRTRGSIFPAADVDLYRFTAAAGDRVYASTMTSGSAGSSADTVLALLASDGTTVLESDNDNGELSSQSSSIAGASIPSAGTYFLRVTEFTSMNTIRPYDLSLRLASGPVPETEPSNNSTMTATAPAGGFVSGSRGSASDQDLYAVNLNAGDTISLGLDLDPERDGITWNGRLGFSRFGDGNNVTLIANDAGTDDAIPSEVLTLTVNTTGTYYARVDGATSGATGTYQLAMTVQPAATPQCRSYPFTPENATIGPSAGLTTFTVAADDDFIVDRAAVSLVLSHTLFDDLDVHLRSPAGNDNGLFSDIGVGAGQTQMNALFDQNAAIPPVFAIFKPLALQPESTYRLSWFEGERSAGTWALDIRDDTTNASGGTFTSGSVILCPRPPRPGVDVTRFSANFETPDDGFTHSGTEDEWERGTPATAATATTNPVAGLSTCAGGTGCWKTDLDNTYNASSSQDLRSPVIDLSNVSGPVSVSWWQWHQMENASFDHVSVDAVESPTGITQRLYNHLDATMTDSVGATPELIGESAGWAEHRVDISAFAGKKLQLDFHLDSNTSVQLGGLAIDDVRVVSQAATAVGWCGGHARKARRGVSVRWCSGRSASTVGFEVLRVRGAGKRAKVTRRLVLAKAARSYSVADSGGRRGDRYLVVERKVSGRAVTHRIAAVR